MSYRYVMCQRCGRRLFKGESGTKVEMDCPKCGGFVSVVIDENNIHIGDKPLSVQYKTFIVKDKPP